MNIPPPCTYMYTAFGILDILNIRRGNDKGCCAVGVDFLYGVGGRLAVPDERLQAKGCPIPYPYKSCSDGTEAVSL